MTPRGSGSGWVLPTVLALSVAAAEAAPVASESFESYAAGTQLESGSGAGLEGGSGWTTAWDVDDARRSEVTVITGGLSYSGGSVVVDGGQRALQFANPLNMGNTPLNALFSRAFPTQNDVVYFSLLFASSTADGPGDEDFMQVGLDSTVGNPRVSFAQRINTGLNPDDMDFMARAGTSANDWTNRTTTPGQTYFLVLRITNATGDADYDRVELWVDPTSDVPGSADATSNQDSGVNSLSKLITRIAFLEAGDTYAFDEIRIGTSFADVIPVPEPAGGLLLLAVLPALLRRVKHRQHG